MPINNLDANKLYFGELPIARAYSGETQIWPPAESEQEQNLTPDTSYIPPVKPEPETYPYILRITISNTRSNSSEFLTFSKLKFYNGSREEINLSNFYSATINSQNYSAYDVDNIVSAYGYSYFATNVDTEESNIITLIYKDAIPTPTYFSIVTSSDSANTDPVSFLIEYSSDNGETFTTLFELSNLDIPRFRNTESKLFDASYVPPIPTADSWIPIYPENWNLFSYGNIADETFLSNPNSIYIDVPKKIYKNVIAANNLEVGSIVNGENTNSTNHLRSVEPISLDYAITLGIDTNPVLNKTVKYICSFYDESDNYIGTSFGNTINTFITSDTATYIPLGAASVRLTLSFSDNSEMTPEDINKCNILLDYNYNNYELIENISDWVSGTIDADTGEFISSLDVTTTCVSNTILELPTLLSSIQSLNIGIKCADTTKNVQYKLYLYDDSLNYLSEHTINNNCLNWTNESTIFTFPYGSSDIKYIKIVARYDDDSTIAPEDLLNFEAFVIYTNSVIINNRNDFGFAETTITYDLTSVENIVIPVDIPRTNETNAVRAYISKHSLNTASKKYNPDYDFLLGTDGTSFNGNINFNVSRFTGEYYIGFVAEYGNELTIYDIDKTDLVSTISSCYKFVVTGIRNLDSGKLKFSEIKFYDSNLVPINVTDGLLSVISNTDSDSNKPTRNIVDGNKNTYFSSDFSEGDSVEFTLNFNTIKTQPTYFSIVTAPTNFACDPIAFKLYYSNDGGTTFTEIINIVEAEMPKARSTESTMFYNGYVKPEEPIGPIEPEEPTGWIPFTNENWNLFSNDSTNCITEITLSPRTLHLKNAEPYAESTLNISSSEHELGSIDINTGNNVVDVSRRRTKEFITIPNKTTNVKIDCVDSFENPCITDIYFYNSVQQYLAQKTIISRNNIENSSNNIVEIPADASYIKYMAQSISSVNDTPVSPNGITVLDSNYNGFKFNLHCAESQAGYEGLNIELPNLVINDSYTIKFSFFPYDCEYWATTHDHRFGYKVVDSVVSDYTDYTNYETLSKDKSLTDYTFTFTATQVTMYLVFNVAALSDTRTNRFKIQNIYLLNDSNITDCSSVLTWNNNISYYKLIDVKNIAWANSDIYANNTIVANSGSNIVTTNHYIQIPSTATNVNLNTNFYENTGLKCRAFIYDSNKNYSADLTNFNGLSDWYNPFENKPISTNITNMNTDSYLRNGGSVFAFSHSNGITIEEQSFSNNKLNIYCSESQAGYEGFTIALQNLTVGEDYTIIFDFNSVGDYFTSQYDHLFGFTITDSNVTDYENTYDVSTYTSLNKTEDFVTYKKTFTATQTTMYMVFNVAGYYDGVTNYFHINNLCVWNEESTPSTKYIRFAIKYENGNLLRTDTLRGGLISFNVTSPITEYANNRTFAETVNKVDFQTIKELTANVTAHSATTNSINIYISSTAQFLNPNTFNPTLLQGININGTDDIVFDVENYDGSYYIGFESGLGSELNVNSLDRTIKEDIGNIPDTPIPGSQVFNLLIFNSEWVAGVYDVENDTMTPTASNTHLRCNYYVPIVDSEFLVQSIASDDTILQNCVVFYNSNKEVVFTSPWTINEYTRYDASTIPGAVYYRVVVRHPEEGTVLSTSSIATSNIYFDEHIDMEDLYIYTALAAVRSDGDDYIDTGLVPTANTKVVLSMRNLTTEDTAIFIASSTWQEDRFYLTYSTTSPYNGFVWGIPEYANISGEKELTNTFSIYRGTVTHNQEVVVDEEVANSYTVKDSTNLYIFGTPSIANKGSVFSLKYFKVYENNVLIRDYIPILDYNSVPCLFDKVNYTYVYNSGLGSLTPEYDSNLDERTMPEMRNIVGVYHLTNYQNDSWKNSAIGLGDITFKGNINSGVTKNANEILVPSNGYSIINECTNDSDSEVRFLYNRLFTYPHYSTAPTFDLPSGLKQYYMYVRYAPGTQGTNSNILGENMIFTSDSPTLLVSGISNITNIFNATNSQVNIPETLPETDLPYMFMYCTNSVGGVNSQIIVADIDTLLFNNDPDSHYYISIDSTSADTHYTTYIYQQTGTDENDDPIYEWVENNSPYLSISWNGTNSDLKSIVINTFPNNIETVHWGHGNDITDVYFESPDSINSPLTIYYKRDDDSNSSAWNELSPSIYNHLALPYTNSRYYGWQLLYNNFIIQSQITEEILNRPALNYIYNNDTPPYNFNDSFTFYFIAKEGIASTKYSTKNIFDYTRLSDTTHNAQFVDSNTNEPTGLYTLEFTVESNSQYILYTNLPGDSMLLQTLTGQCCTSENNGSTTITFNIGNTNKLYLLFNPNDYYYTDATNGLFEIQLEKVEQSNKHIYQPDATNLILSTPYEPYITSSTHNGVIFSTLNSVGEGIEISSLDRSNLDLDNLITITTSDGTITTDVPSGDYHLYTIAGNNGTASVYVDGVLVQENITYSSETLNTCIKLCKDHNDSGSDYINSFKFLALGTSTHTATEISRNTDYLVDMYNIERYTPEVLITTELGPDDFENLPAPGNNNSIMTSDVLDEITGQYRAPIEIPENSKTYTIKTNYVDFTYSDSSLPVEYSAFIYDSDGIFLSRTNGYLADNTTSILPENAKYMTYELHCGNVVSMSPDNLIYSNITWNKNANKYHIVTLLSDDFEEGAIYTTNNTGGSTYASDYRIRSSFLELPLNLDIDTIQVQIFDTDTNELDCCILLYDNNYNYLEDYTSYVSDMDGVSLSNVPWKSNFYTFYLPFLRKTYARYIKIMLRNHGQDTYILPEYIASCNLIYMKCLRETNLRNLNWSFGTYDDYSSADVDNRTDRLRCNDYINIQDSRYIRLYSKLVDNFSKFCLFFYREDNIESGSYIGENYWLYDWNRINISGSSISGISGTSATTTSLNDANYMRIAIKKYNEYNGTSFTSVNDLKSIEISIVPVDNTPNIIQPYVYTSELPVNTGIEYDFDFLDNDVDDSYLSIVQGTSSGITETDGHGIDIDKSTILSYLTNSTILDAFTIYLVTEENSVTHLFTFAGSTSDDVIDVYIDGMKVDEGFHYLEESLDSDSSNTMYYKYFAIGSTKQDYTEIILNNNYLIDKYHINITKEVHLYTGTLPTTLNTNRPILDNYRIYGNVDLLGIKENLWDLSWEQGTVYSGNISSSSNQLRTTTTIELDPGTYVLYSLDGYTVDCEYYHSATINTGNYSSSSGWQSSPYTFNVTYPNNYIQFVLKNNNSPIIPNDVTDMYLIKKDYITLPYDSYLGIECYSASTISSGNFVTESNWENNPYTFTITDSSPYIQILMCAKDNRNLDLNTMGIILVKDSNNEILYYLTGTDFELGSVTRGNKISSTTRVRTINTINLTPGQYTMEHIIPNINYDHYNIPVTSTIGAKTLTTYVDIGTRALNSGEYVDSITQMRYNANGSTAHLNLPLIPTFNGNTIIDVTGSIKPENVELIYTKDIESP